MKRFILSLLISGLYIVSFTQSTISPVPLNNFSPEASKMVMADHLIGQTSEERNILIGDLYKAKDNDWNNLSSSISNLKNEYDKDLLVLQGITSASKMGVAVATDIFPPLNVYANTINTVTSEIVEFYSEMDKDKKANLLLGAMQKKVNEASNINLDMSDSEKINFITDAVYEATNNENRAISNQVMTKVVSKFVAANSNTINQVIKGQKTIAFEINSLRNEITSELNNLDSKITKNTFQIRKLSGAVNQLYENDKIIFAQLDEINQRVKVNSARITNNSNRIQANFQNIDINRRNIIENRALIQENRGLIAKNSQDISTINNYLLGNLNIEKQIQALKQGDLGTSSLDPDDRNLRIRELEKIQTIESITSMTNDINTAVRSGMQVAEVLGLFDSDEGREVASFLSKGLELGTAGVGFATSIMSGNVMGMITNGANLITGLFGGEPQKSAELQAIEAMDAKLDEMMKMNQDGFNMLLEGQTALFNGQVNIQKTLGYMQENIDHHFNNVYKNFNRLNNRIDGLATSIEFARKELFEQSHLMIELLEKIDDKIDVLQETSELILNRDFRACLSESFVPGNVWSLSDLHRQNSGSINTCFKGLSQISDASDFEWFTSEKYRTLQSDNYFDIQNENLLILKNLSNSLNTNQRNTILNNILNPNSDLNGSTWSRTRRIAQTNDSFGINYNEVYSQLLNPFMVYMASEKYLKYLPFFEFRSKNQELYVIEEIEDRRANIYQNKLDITRTLDFLLKSVNISIAQQALLSGEGVLPFIDERRTSNDEKIYNLLRYNPRLKRNLELYLFTRDFPINSTNERFIEEIDFLNNEYRPWTVKNFESSYGSLFSKLLSASEEKELRRKIDYPIQEDGSYYKLIYSSSEESKLEDINWNDNAHVIKLETMQYFLPKEKNPTPESGGGRYLPYAPTELIGISYNLKLLPVLSDLNDEFNISERLSGIQQNYRLCQDSAADLKSKLKCKARKRSTLASINNPLRSMSNQVELYQFNYFSKEDLRNPKMQYDPILKKLLGIRSELLIKKKQLETNSLLSGHGVSDQVLNALYLDNNQY